jgi:hypothetical protein
MNLPKKIWKGGGQMNRDDIEKLLDLNEEKIRTLYMGWDKGDCSLIGLIRILLIQEIRKEIKSRKGYYDGQYEDLLEALYEKYYT